MKVPVLAKKQHKSEQAFKFRPAQMNYFETARKINFLLETSNSVLDMGNCLENETPKSGKFSSRTEHFASLVEMTNSQTERVVASESKYRCHDSRSPLDLYSLYGRTAFNPSAIDVRENKNVFNFI